MLRRHKDRVHHLSEIFHFRATQDNKTGIEMDRGAAKRTNKTHQPDGSHSPVGRVVPGLRVLGVFGSLVSLPIIEINVNSQRWSCATLSFFQDKVYRSLSRPVLRHRISKSVQVKTSKQSFSLTKHDRCEC